MKKQLSISAGFTLVEMLTAIFIIVFIGGIIGTIFISSLKGNNKATLLDVARQNGTFALSQIEKTLRNAQTLTSPSVPCLSLTPTPMQSITVAGVNGVSTTFSCSGGTITANGSPLIDTSNLKVLDFNALVPSSCSFICVQSSSADYPTLTAQFTITQKASTSFFEQKVSLPFQSSVTLRNMNR